MDNKQNNCESGYTMIGVLIIFTIVTVLGLSIITLSFASVKTSTSERNHQSAYYIAEAGLTYQMAKLKNDILEIYERESVRTESDFLSEIEKLKEENNEYSEFAKMNNIQPFAEMSVHLLDDTNDHFMIESTGIIGEEKRTVSNSLQVEWEDKYQEIEREPYQLPPFAVFTAGSLTMDNGAINGDIGTVSHDEGTISFPSGGPSHYGSIYVQDGNQNIVHNQVSTITSEIKELDQSYIIPELPPFPDIPDTFLCMEDQTISLNDNETHDVIKDCNLYINNYIVRDSNYKLVVDQDMRFNKMFFEGDYHLTIDIGDSNKSIVVDHLNLSNGHIHLKGSGKLTIYVTGKITMGSGSTINNHGDVSKLDVYLKGSNSPENAKKVTMSGSQKVFGSLYAEDADIELEAGGGFVGNIFTGGKSFKISDGSYNQAQLFFAPHAFFDMKSGGTKFEGMIIADTYAISGGWDVHYKNLEFTDGPISPAALGMENGGGNGGSGGTEFIETGASPTITPTPPRER